MEKYDKIEKHNYNWQRYWYKRGEELSIENGFLKLPKNKYEINKNSIVTFDSICDKDCLILLGDAGLGKSTVMAEEVQKLKNRLEEKNIMNVDLRSASSDIRLDKLIFEKSVFVNWMNADYDLYLFLDSLDEGLLQVGALGQIIIEKFRNVDISRLKLRITCRTGVLPSTFEAELKELWKEENFDVFQLAFLSIEDVKIACEEWKYDSIEFLKSVTYNNIEALASTPVTLEMLLKIYDKNQQRLPSSKVKLYEDGCRILCSEVNSSRLEKTETRGNLSPDKRMEIAMLLGAITMFCNKSNIVKGSLLDTGEISIDEFLTITFDKFNYKLVDVEEVLGSALFTEKNHNVYSWAHLSYAEFLAAKFIQQNHFTKKQIISLIFQSEDDNNRIIPQLHYTASWIASFSEKIFLEIAEKDPDILCLSDISQMSHNNKEKLVKSLLNKYNLCNEYGRYGNSINYKKLKYDGLDIQLTEFIKDDKNSDYSKSIAIYIAYECELHIMANEILNLFINNKRNNFYLHDRLNYKALIIFFKLADEKQKKLSLKILDEYLNGSGISYVIRNLYPNYMTIYDVIKVIKKGYFNYYERFSEMTSILECISIDDMIILMMEFDKESIEKKDFNHEIMDIILIYCWRYIDKDDFCKIWTSIAVNRFKAFGTPIIHTSIVNSNINEFIAAFRLEFEKRINIIKAIWINNINTKCDDIVNSKLVLVNKDDLENILITAVEEKDRSFQDWLISLLLYLYCPNSLDNSENYRGIYEKLQLIKKNIKDILLLKNEILDLKVEYDNKISKVANFNFGKKPSKDKMCKIIYNFKNDVVKYWPSCVNEMYEQYFFMLNYNEYSLTRSEGWELLNEDEQKLIIEAAKEFLLKFKKDDFDVEDINSPIIEAIQLTWEKCRGFIESWDRDMWEKVLDYVIEPNSSSYLNQEEYFKIAYQYFPKKVSNLLMQEMIKKRTIGSWCGSRQIAENRIIFCQDSFLLDSIIKTLKSHKIAFTSRGDLFKLIIEIGEERGICYINNLIDSRYNSIFSCAVAVEAVCSLMKKASNGGEDKILPIIESENKRDKHFMVLVLKRYLKDRPEFVFFDTWSMNGLVKLYIFLHVNKYKNFDQDEWKRLIIDEFSNKKDIKSMFFIFELNKRISDCNYIKSLWERMREKYFRQIWNPPSGSMIVDMIGNAELTPISNGNQLLDILIDSLYDFQKEMNYSETPLVELLWNTFKDTAIPKDEGALSNFLKKHLCNDLKNKGVILNREVEVFHNQGGEKGERLDIKADVPCGTYSSQPITVYIEVKGCWNPGLDTSMEEQLVKRYMANRKCDYGVYVIGWFNCKQWTLKKDTRKGPKYSLEDAKKKFNDQAKRLSQKYGVKIKAVVLDLSLK
ncbi:TPA: hypothetical protein PTV68_000742 [Clostridium botulinum]|uniref:NACHT domain-containing protein n=1 Tax=Clostridium botulinum TaxID=1491 RepID=UPI0029AD2B52|nr:hypothetical protein [Clostridium botulinum]HDK7189621.1 hypothetical protein [Clostridium botulinum]HDK7217227.1 hypothetical protein [Clostridium botulinum]HDK7232681.1 hypothetical protein [Clostridium botulinum]HDK7259484.1 hypothetical protein [Clostridium botulinum]